MTDLDPLLREAMTRMQGPVGARPSLIDVRHRARRRNRRRMSVTAGVVACAGVATTALIIRRDGMGSSVAGQSGTRDRSSASTLYQPDGNATTTIDQVPAPIDKMQITPSSVWDALYSARYDPTGAGLAVEPVDQAAREVMPTPEQFGCTSAECRAMFTYVVWHELAKKAGFGGDVVAMKAFNRAIDFSIPPVAGAVLLSPGQFATDPTTTSNAGEMSPTTVVGCDSSSAAPVAVVVNASHVVGTAKWWNDMLTADVPIVSFATPVNALAAETSSRVLAVAGSECQASLIASFTTATTVEPATLQDLQSLVAAPLPAGTAIVVLVGDDVMSRFTTGVTTTSNG